MDSSHDGTDNEGYAKGLGNRQVQMIAMGGAIGVGLFLGAGGRLHDAGPGLILSYALCGAAAFFVMRALGELVLYRPTSGSFVTYAREFIGPWAGFAAGWTYWLGWATTGIAEITAVGIYVHRWLPNLPQWTTALIALVALLVINLASVKLFGELEFWFSVIKVTAIVVFLVVGIGLVVTSTHIDGHTAGLANLVNDGGFFPHGVGVALIALQAVVFAYAGIELLGIAAGEAKDPHKVMPKAVNGVVWRIAIFYVGSVTLLAMLLPSGVYSADTSPFVTVFSSLGVPWVPDVMNAIVLTAALSSINSGLYSTGRVLRTLADRKEAPAFAGKMNSRQVPYGGILFTSVIYVAGIALNQLKGAQAAFDIATALASLGVIFTWGTLVYCQMRLRKAAERGELRRPGYRMPGAPVTNWLTLGFLALVMVMMGVAGGAETVAFYSVPAIVVVIALGWWVVRRRQIAAGIGVKLDPASAVSAGGQ